MIGVVLPIAAQNPDSSTLVVVMEDEEFRKEGAKEKLKLLDVRVGQKVMWLNKDDDLHSATSKAKKADGKRLFETGDLDKDQKKEILFSAEIYKDAGGAPGGDVQIDYFCRHHPGMRSAIRLKP
jgi:plastocyanin